jgi:hypothetical protein
MHLANLLLQGNLLPQLPPHSVLRVCWSCFSSVQHIEATGSVQQRWSLSHSPRADSLRWAVQGYISVHH